MTKALIQQNLDLALSLPTGNLDGYIQTVRQVPALSFEEEQDLAARLRDHGDLDAARTLILSNLRFVVHIARSYSGYGLALGDLVQEGNIGLMKAVKRFDPAVGVRLVSFAVHWIRAEIHEFVLRNWRIVKVATTKAQRKLFFNLRRAKKRLGWFTAAEVDAVANDLGVKPETVVEMESRLSGQDLGFDKGADDDDHDAAMLAPASYLQNQSMDPASEIEAADWEQHHSHNLYQALEQLDERTRTIVSERWLADKKTTLIELAKRFGVSAERIRQLENSAIKKLKSTLEA